MSKLSALKSDAEFNLTVSLIINNWNSWKKEMWKKKHKQKSKKNTKPVALDARLSSTDIKLCILIQQLMSADRHGAEFVNIYFRKHQKQIEIHIHLSKFDGFTVTMLLRLAELMEYHLAKYFNCIPKIISNVF